MTEIDCYEVSWSEEGDLVVGSTPVPFDTTAGAEAAKISNNSKTKVYEPTDPRKAKEFPNCLIKIRFGGLEPDIEEIEFSKKLEEKSHSSLQGWCPKIHRVWKVAKTYFVLEDKMKGKTLYEVLEGLNKLEKTSRGHSNTKQEVIDKYGRILLNVLERFKLLHALDHWHGDMNFSNVLVDSNEFVSFVDFESIDDRAALDHQKWKCKWLDCHAIYSYLPRSVPLACRDAWETYMNSLLKYPKKRKR